MSELLLTQLRANGPVSPAVQMRELLRFGRDRDWEFEVAWRWSWERVKWPHDTGHRLQWKDVLGESPADARRQPVAQRDVWRRAYERDEPTRKDRCVGRLLIAA